MMSDATDAASRKPPLSPRPQSASPKPSLYPSLIDCEPPASIRTPIPTSQGGKRSNKPCEKCPKQRVRSASAGRSPRHDLQARYWALLFENLHRAVDEIYQTCENDESVAECKEAVLMLENYAQEFRSLITWLRLSKDLEKIPPPNRPTSLAWEVRKSSPGKGALKSIFLNYINSACRKWPPVNSGKASPSISTGIQTDPEERNWETSAADAAEDTLKDSSDLKETSVAVENNISTDDNVLNDVCPQPSSSDLDPSPVAEPKISDTSDISGNVCTSVQTDPVTPNSETVSVPEETQPEQRKDDPESSSSPLDNSNATEVKKKDETVQVTTSVQSQNSVSVPSSTSVVVTTPIITPVVVSKTAVSTLTKISTTSACQTKSASGAKPTTSVINTQTVQSAKSVSSVSSRTGVNTTRTNTFRTNYQPKIPSESRRGVPDRRSGFSNPPRRGGYQPASTRDTDRRGYGLSRAQAALPVGSGFKLTKDHQKTGSTSSVSSTSSGQSWADKVKGTPAVDKNLAGKSKKDEEDNEGWETVHRGRTRSRTSPVKAAQASSLSASLTNLKEEEPMRRPPVLRRVHTEISTFSARGTKAAGGSEMSKKPSTSKPVSSAKGASVRLTNKEPVKSTYASTRHRNAAGQKTIAQTRIERNVATKRAEDLVRKGSSLKPFSDVKSVLDTHVRKGQDSKIKDDKEEVRADKGGGSKIEPISEKPEQESKETSKDVNIDVRKETNVVCDAEKIDLGCREELELSEKEILLSGVQKEEELGTCEGKSDDESELTIEEKSLGKINADDEDDYDDFSAKEKILEEEDEDDVCPDSDVFNSDPLGDDTEEELNTFDDNQIDWDEYRRQKIEQIHQLGLNWGEQMDMLDLECRTPGRAPQMHEKLSSPFRKRSVSETLRRHEEKLAKAQEQRERLLEEKAQKFKDLAKKAEEIKKGKEEQQEQMRMMMLVKLQKAEEKRRMQLQRIVRKAHDEEEKVNEIAFINTLEAQNKRHDILSKEKDHELRLTELQEERHRKQEEKAAKEAAAEERRKALEAERQTKLLEMQEKRKLRDQKIEQQFQEKEKERQELANQKARDREQRLNALTAAQQASLEELQKKIQQKQEESARRHEENIEQIRQKAFELSVRRYSSNSDEAPRLVPYETKKLCTLCNVLIASEVYLLSHLRGKKHQEAVKDKHQGMEPPTEALELYNIKHIVDAPAGQIDPTIALDKERQKALKKRCKKIKQRLLTKGQEWEKQNNDKVSVANSPFKQKFQKSIRELQRHLSALSSSSWESNIVTSLERLLGECERCLEKGHQQDKLLFQQIGGTAAILQMQQQILMRAIPEKTPQIVPDKTLARAAVVYRLACLNSPENCLNTLLSNKVIVLLDLLMSRLKDLVPDNRAVLDPSTTGGTVPVDPVAGALLGVLATALIRPANTNEAGLASRIQDVVGYTVSLGVVDKLSHYLGQVRDPLDTQPQVAEFILNVVSFLGTLCATLQGNRYDSVFEARKEDETQLLATLQVTELAGTVSVLYGMLLHGGAPSRDDNCPPPLLEGTSQALALATLRMLNRIALLDYQMMQSVLGGEGLSLQLRHIASYLLWFCSRGENPQLLHEVILLVGYFALLHPDNQVVLQSGQCPSVLQQLCSLPFCYFSDPELTEVLFPTLVACCFASPANRFILEQEMSTELLANYVEASLLDVHKDSLSGRTEKKGEAELRLSFGSRFPKNKWTSAKNFFLDRSAIA